VISLGRVNKALDLGEGESRFGDPTIMH
jgi:hypothetical protein